MRTQKEILEKLEEIKRGKADPMGVQWKTLSRKLEWANAKPYINPKYHNNTEEREKWKATSRVDKKTIDKHIADLMDSAVDNYYQHEYVQDMGNIQVFMCLIWLFGEPMETLLGEIISIFLTPTFNAAYDTIVIYQLICKEFGLNWKTYEQRYNPNARGKILLPGEGEF